MKIATKWKESAYYELCGSKKNFGFGCMRLPMQGEEVDLAQFSQMVDEYLAAGFNYFDTARVYLGGKSEPAIRERVAKRYRGRAFCWRIRFPTRCLRRRKSAAAVLKAAGKLLGGVL